MIRSVLRLGCLVALLSFVACGSSSDTAGPSGSGTVGIEDLVVGSGPTAAVGDVVTVNYVGTFTNGAKFDSSYDRGQPYVFRLGVGAVIAGWDQGVPGMRVGGKRRLTIPPSLAYGSAGSPPTIPPNATLIFDIELVSIAGK